MASHEKNFYIVNSSTPISEIEIAFNIFTKERGDIAILLITQTLAEKIRTLCDRYTQAFPALLEIPARMHRTVSGVRCDCHPLSPTHCLPTDPSKDSVLKRCRRFVERVGTPSHSPADLSIAFLQLFGE
ncbi:hypothetical protein L7F22_003555 [Adiantum nelumboides]|nr:hypothetical protein [Adiantum nelumboides]